MTDIMIYWATTGRLMLPFQAVKDDGIQKILIFVDRASGGTLNRPQFIEATKYASRPSMESLLETI